MSGRKEFEIMGDRALSSGDDDKLGFREVAKLIATSLVDRATRDGFVVGLEGSWGSGKSSLLFLIENEIANLTSGRRPSVINFRPWLIGNRDALIRALFEDLLSEIQKVASNNGDLTHDLSSKAIKAKEALRRFMKGLSRAGGIIETVGTAAGVPYAGTAGQFFTALGEVTSDNFTPPPLSELKDQLVKALQDLEHRIIIAIDDVDRLEPGEVIEVLRLVRSVVDLPGVIYLLCYDSKILTHSIERATGVESGIDYLEKIVQLTVMVPQPESLQLRHWFSDELSRIASVKNEDEEKRLQQVIYYEGAKSFRTPRSVKRVLDAIRFIWPPLRELRADLADLVWLQIIKEGNPALYRWLEEYCATAASVALGIERVEEDRRRRMLSSLYRCVPDGYFDDKAYNYYFAGQLPGFDVDFGDKLGKFDIFSKVDELDRNYALTNNRLSSPDHYRLYFALDIPSSALPVEELGSIWIALRTSAEAGGDAILKLHKKTLSGSLTKADIFLERINGQVYENLDASICENLLSAFANIMDDAYRARNYGASIVDTIWGRARRIVPLLLIGVGADRSQKVLTEMFSKGSAIGWLTSLLRSETFAHGRVGSRSEPESEWLLSEIQLDLITELLVGRYSSMSVSEVLDSIYPQNVYFAWIQAGDKTGPRKLMQDAALSDHDFLSALECSMAATRVGQAGPITALSRENIEDCLDMDFVREKVTALISDPVLGELARKINAAL